MTSQPAERFHRCYPRTPHGCPNAMLISLPTFAPRAAPSPAQCHLLWEGHPGGLHTRSHTCRARGVGIRTPTSRGTSDREGGSRWGDVPILYPWGPFCLLLGVGPCRTKPATGSLGLRALTWV